MVRVRGNERVENALGVTPGDLHEEVLHRISGELSSNKIDLLLVHVAEGAPEDLESTVEFRALKGAGLLGSHTAIIHGVALGPDQFKEMANSGTALIWSPRSNCELYGFTADVASAKKANVTITLAPDWSPTGSTNSLAELLYAKQVSHEKLGDLFSDQDLFEMSTSIPARMAKIDDKVGSVKKRTLRRSVRTVGRRHAAVCSFDARKAGRCAAGSSRRSPHLRER